MTQQNIHKQTPNKTKLYLFIVFVAFIFTAVEFNFVMQNQEVN